MSTAKCYSAHLVGLSIEIITVEVDISTGLNSVSIVGLGDRAVEEAKDRVAAAIKNTGYISPKQKNQKVVISLAPAHVRKEGPNFDLAIAVSYLMAAQELEFNTDKVLFIGELSLQGELRHVGGLLPILCQARKHGFNTVVVPKASEAEASLAPGIRVYAISSLAEATLLITKKIKLEPVRKTTHLSENIRRRCPDLNQIRGNEAAKRGMEIAAAGAHNILMFGPPGTGKTMLAQSFCSILPPLSLEQSIEVTSIHSAAYALRGELVTEPPFRAPHHTASYPAVVGGGSFPRPGEITLAHRGVLFLDEFPEFDRSVLEALRQPLEEREITVSRARGSVTFPAQCILIASMNPCPCGKPQGGGCLCTKSIIAAYRRRISGPIMDRLDIWVNVSKVDYAKLAARKSASESSETVRSRVAAARAVQVSRFRKHGIDKRYNSEMSAEDIGHCIQIDEPARKMLRSAAEKLSLSGRSFHRVLKVSQTIADLAGDTMVAEKHVLEALQYRQKMDAA